jgi:hypothetical protein
MIVTDSVVYKRQSNAVEYRDRNLAIRSAEALMPKVANGIYFEADLACARAENVELELHVRAVGKRPGTLRLLSYVNHANMGDYQQQINDGLTTHSTPVPEITDHPLETTVKYGFGVNFEQPVTSWFGVFGRWGWNEGQHESFAYTEVDQTWEIGGGGSGTRWGRRNDQGREGESARVGCVIVRLIIVHRPVHELKIRVGAVGIQVKKSAMLNFPNRISNRRSGSSRNN